MALFLVQHGKSLPKDEDPECGLSAEGFAEVQRIAEVARGYGVPVEEIVHSGKKRARQTAEIFAEHLDPPSGIQEREGLKPMDDVTPVAEQADTKENLMLVGHLPFMERLASFLITGDTEILVFKFQNGGIVCMDQDSTSKRWFIKWALMPRVG